MVTRNRVFWVLGVLVFVFQVSLAQENTRVPLGAKVYIQPMDGLESYVVAALTKKKVPVVVVTDRESAQFEITGTVNRQAAEKATQAENVTETVGSIFGARRKYRGPELQAAITVKEIKSGVIAFSHASYKAANDADRRVAEDFANNLKKNMPKK